MLLFALRRSRPKTAPFRVRRLGSQRAEAASFGSVRCFSQTSALKEAKNVPGIYVANVEGRQNSSPILLGLADYFERHLSSVGFFQPVAGEPFPNSTTGLSRHIDLMRSAFNMKQEASQQSGISAKEAAKLLSTGQTDEMMDIIYNKYVEYRKQHDLVIIEGLNGFEAGLGNVNELNAKVAATLETPVLLVLDSRTKDGFSSANDLANSVLIDKQSYSQNNAALLGVVLNKVNPKEHSIISQQVKSKVHSNDFAFAGAIPFNPLLNTVRLNEMKAALGSRLLYGQNDSLDAEVNEVLVASEGINELLDHLHKMDARPLVITSRDRTDVLWTLLTAHSNPVGPRVAGILLTSEGTGPTGLIDRMLSSAYGKHGRLEGAAGAPVMIVDKPMYQVCQTLGQIQASVLPTSALKIDHAKEAFAKYVDVNSVAESLAAPKATRLTPKAFMHSITQKCQANPQHIVLPESSDKRVLTAATQIVRKGLAQITLLGDPESVSQDADRLGLDLTGINVVDHMKTIDKYVGVLCEARKKKGLTEQQARDNLQDINVYGTLMVLAGDADGMVSGATTTTANTIRPALQVLKSKDRPLVSSVFFMCLPDKVLVYGDCAVNVEPSAEELALIAVTSAETAAAFGVTPRVAMLSYSTGVSGAGPQVEKVKKAVEAAKSMRSDLFLEGPIQYDAAVDPEIAKQKIKTHSEVAGQANVCIFPDLNTGNNTYKAVQQSTGAIAMGPVMQGLTKPVNDLSRGCTVADIINTVACTSVQALGLKSAPIK
ncbi:TPA: hypothetical protein ACH3X2_013283 [Trebouxia sp. C0005]|nr:MAG: phosphate acetyltransferase [Trebouxia sp. A1-2]